MADEEDELEKLKEERMNQIQDSDETIDPEEQQEQRRQQIKQQAAKYLTKEAKSRLGNIRAAQPDFASAVEMHIAQMGKAGRLEKVTDEQLKEILRAIQNEKSQDDTDIKFRR